MYACFAKLYFLYPFRFEEELAPLPQLPEMLFNDNVLRVIHNEGFGIEFNALDSLRSVDPSNDLMKVAAAESWQSTR